MKKKFIILITCSLLSCTKTRTENFMNFSLELPQKWKVHKLQGIDSYVRLITTDKNDSIYLDYGRYSNSLKYYPPIIAPLKKKEMLLSFGLEESEVIFLDKDSITKNDRDIYKERIEIFDEIGGKKAKIVLPKIGEIGIGGVYFENFQNENRLTIYGGNLNKEKSLNLIKVVKTLKYTKR